MDTLALHDSLKRNTSRPQVSSRRSTTVIRSTSSKSGRRYHVAHRLACWHKRRPPILPLRRRHRLYPCIHCAKIAQNQNACLHSLLTRTKAPLNTRPLPPASMCSNLRTKGTYWSILGPVTSTSCQHRFATAQRHDVSPTCRVPVAAVVQEAASVADPSEQCLRRADAHKRVQHCDFIVRCYFNELFREDRGGVFLNKLRAVGVLV